MSGWLVLRTAGDRASLRINRRTPWVLAALGAGAAVAATLNMGTGQYPLSPAQVVSALLGHAEAEQAFIVTTLRLPRMLTAFLVGVGLATAGGILQGLTRNGLAAPGILGLTAGANLAAVVFIVVLPQAPASAIPFAAFTGATVAALAVYLLAWRQGTGALRLILVGVGITFLAHSVTTAVISLNAIHLVSQAVVWMAGSVYGRSWEHVRPLAFWLAVLLPAALLWARHLDVLQLGDDAARGLGSRVELHRGILLGLATLLTGAAVAAAGPVGFVGLLAPHVARRLLGAASAAALPVAALTGGMLVLVADLTGRALFAPQEVPAGLITAVLGGPYLLYLLHRRHGF